MIEESVAGVVIGQCNLQAILTYEGRKQGGILYGSNEADLMRLAEKQKQEILKENKSIQHLIYRSDAGWQMKVM